MKDSVDFDVSYFENKNLFFLTISILALAELELDKLDISVEAEKAILNDFIQAARMEIESVRKKKDFTEDRRMAKLFMKFLFSNFLYRLRSVAGSISCKNCEKFLDCKIKNNFEKTLSDLKEKGYMGKMEEYFRSEAEKCNEYTPDLYVCHPERWVKYVDFVEKVCNEYQFRVSKKLLNKMKEVARKEAEVFYERLKSRIVVQ